MLQVNHIQAIPFYTPADEVCFRFFDQDREELGLMAAPITIMTAKTILEGKIGDVYGATDLGERFPGLEKESFPCLWIEDCDSHLVIPLPRERAIVVRLLRHLGTVAKNARSAAHLKELVNPAWFTVQIGEAPTMKNVTVTLGNGVTFTGDVVVAEAITNSFNRADGAPSGDLKVLLKELTTAVAAAVSSLPPDKAAQATQDLETLAKEATSAKPRQKWWQLSAEGLKEAAAAVGALGKPIFDVLGKLLPILAGTPPG